MADSEGSSKRTLLLVALGFGFIGAASANTVYDVNQVIGGGGVVGTITTDGLVGVLTASDIVAWDLMLTGSNGSTAFHMVSGGSGVEVGNISDPFNPNAGTPALTADANHIYFNYDATDGGYLAFQTLPFYGGQQYWCNASQNNNFDCAQGKSVVPVLYSDPSSIYERASGNQVIASVSAVPEPMSVTMMVAGLTLVVAARRHMRGKTAA